MLYLTDTFSFRMLPEGNAFEIQVTSSRGRDPAAVFKGLAALFREHRFESFVRNETMARILEAQLGLSIPVNRRVLTLVRGDDLILVQYSGPKIPKGATELPKGARVDSFWVHLSKALLIEGTPLCEYCGLELTPEDRAMGWPVRTADGYLSCPGCYGPKAFGPSGEVLRPEQLQL